MMSPPQIHKKEIMLKEFLVSHKQPFYKIEGKKKSISVKPSQNELAHGNMRTTMYRIASQGIGLDYNSTASSKDISDSANHLKTLMPRIQLIHTQRNQQPNVKNQDIMRVMAINP